MRKIYTVICTTPYHLTNCSMTQIFCGRYYVVSSENHYHKSYVLHIFLCSTVPFLPCEVIIFPFFFSCSLNKVTVRNSANIFKFFLIAVLWIKLFHRLLVYQWYLHVMSHNLTRKNLMASRYSLLVNVCSWSDIFIC